MIYYLARRLVYSVFVLLFVATVIFIVVRAVPGNPAQVLLGPNATPDEIMHESQKLGLNQPLVSQYGKYLLGVSHLDFGNSSQFGTSAMSIVMDRLPASGLLAGASMLVALVIAFGLGPVMASRVDTRFERGTLLGILFVQALPEFWVGLLLLLVLTNQFLLLPAEGLSGWKSLVMPAITLSYPFACVLTRLVRSGVLDVQSAPYIQAAQSKGLSASHIFLKHSLRNMLVPILTVAGVQLGMLFSGAAVVETVFNWPGVGLLLVSGIQYRDYGLVEADIFVFAAVFLILNVLVDLSYALIDPRVRVGGGLR